MSRLLRNGVFLYLIIIFALIFTDLYSHLNKPLKTSISTGGITALANAWTPKQAQTILSNWNKAPAPLQVEGYQNDISGITKVVSDELSNTTSATNDTAIRLLGWNFVVIVVYSLLLASVFLQTVLYYGASSRAKVERAGKWSIWGVLVMGILNNILLLSAVKSGHPVLPWLTALSYWIYGKLIIVTVALCIIPRIRLILGLIPQLFSLLWEFRIVFAGLLFTWLILWVMDQGQDLLLTITSQPLGPIVSLSVISIFAVTNWYFPKYYDKTPQSVREVFSDSWQYTFNGDKPYEERIFTGRLLGAAGLILPGICVLHAMHIFRISYLIDFLQPSTIMVILLILYYLILQKKWFTNIKWLLIAALFLIALLSYSGLRSSENTQPGFLLFFALDFFLLSFVFILFTINRSSFPGLNRWLSTLILSAVIIVSLVFLYLNCFPLALSFSANARFFTLSVVFSGVLFYILFFSFLLVLGRKYNIQFITLLVIGLFVAALFTTNDYHLVRLVPEKSSNIAQTPPYDHLEDYASKWFDTRETEITAYYNRFHKPYPVFIINAYGGGIRAAAWTSKVISSIETTLLQHTRNDTDSTFRHDFQHYVFAYSGISGGTIGSSVLCAHRFAKLKNNNLLQEDTVLQCLYKRDFLTPVLVLMMGRDALLSSFGYNFMGDRGSYQERIWEKHISEAAHLMKADFVYDSTLDYYWYRDNKRYEVPLLFANSYTIDSGLKTISAPVYLNENNFPSAFLINNYLGEKRQYSQQMRLSTSSFLSARFPYISPEAKIDNTHHLLDGGLKDYSGAETVREIKLVLDSIVAHRDSLKTRVRFFILSLPNTIEQDDEQPVSKNIFELTAPLTGLVNNPAGNTLKSEGVNINAAKREGYDYSRIPPIAPKGQKGIRPVFPLGWQISDAALDFMDNCLLNGANREAVHAVADSIYK
ncbi:hypothetical protein [Chitinophaga sp. Cy-1792]|uniref:hypothetical protein n=1 Tax=Chitinophaga sp. Cy-1792 TaxID=2608339 RepID=UPI001420B89A|nr:hypothetical protein [Chitinophaga sp. Cy-1792]NIG54136.1 hypothetical protein [Chitinophaga sp. Cy-1792]